MASMRPHKHSCSSDGPQPRNSVAARFGKLQAAMINPFDFSTCDANTLSDQEGWGQCRPCVDLEALKLLDDLARTDQKRVQTCALCSC
jgi:hypothetical protein